MCALPAPVTLAPANYLSRASGATLALELGKEGVAWQAPRKVAWARVHRTLANWQEFYSVPQ
jgi:hypothetical protein